MAGEKDVKRLKEVCVDQGSTSLLFNKKTKVLFQSGKYKTFQSHILNAD